MKKVSATVALMLATFLMAMPLLPARGASHTVLSVLPSPANAEVGSQFTVDVAVNDVSNLAAYQFRIHFDPHVLAAVNIDMGHTAFDLNNNGIITDDPVLILTQDVFNSIGLIRFQTGLLGHSPIAIVDRAALLHVTFLVLRLALPLPSPITIDNDILATLSGGISVAAPHDTVNGAYIPAANIAAQGPGCRVIIPEENTLDNATPDLLGCSVMNTGSISIVAKAVFRWQSIAGQSGTISSPTVTLAPGQVAELDAGPIIVSEATDVWTFTGTPSRAVTLSDGSLFDVAGQSIVFRLALGNFA